MKRVSVVLVLVALTLAVFLAGCTRDSGIMEPATPWGPVSFQIAVDQSVASQFNEGDEVLIAGNFAKGWSPANTDVMEHAGVIHNGLPVVDYSRQIPAGGETYTVCFFVRDQTGHFTRLLNISANGIPLTALKADRYQVYREFQAYRGVEGQVIVDPGPDDNAKLVTVTLVYDGIAFTDPAHTYLNRAASRSEQVQFYSTWNTIGQHVDAVWRNGQWEQVITVVKGTTMMVRAELLNGTELRPGLFVGTTELKNLYDLNGLPPVRGGDANYYPVFEFMVNNDGTIANPRAGDERWPNITIHKPGL